MITNELISEIKSKINDNQKQAITGGVLQGVLVDMVNGLTTTGLAFLGILSPGDPAPSNEITNGYYLSFQRTTEKTPYFNGFHLHRYSMLIWTQDEQGRWKFDRIKYEDHRGPERIVVGRALPIHYNQYTNTYTIHLSGDGTRDTYAICGRQVLRGEENGLLAHHFSGVYGAGRKCGTIDQYYFVRFRKEDDGKTLAQNELYDFIDKRINTFEFNLRACSEAYEIIKNGIISWRPKIQNTNTTRMKRVIRNNGDRTRPDGSIAPEWVVKNIPREFTQLIGNGVFRRAKRYNLIDSRRRAAGLSENYIEINTGNTLYTSKEKKREETRGQLN